MSKDFVNVAVRLTQTARAIPDALAVVEPRGRDRNGARCYRQVTFAQLDEESDRLAAGLRERGATPGSRIVLMVRPGIDFISLTFALLKAGAVVVLIDPGMGWNNLLRCLVEVQPQGFVALPLVHAVRTVLRRRFRHARLNVTVGRRWFWGGPTLRQLRACCVDRFTAERTRAESGAAIIFTTGSTGPPKGVLYTHGNFDQQVRQIRDHYGIERGEIDLPMFPLFGLFNGAMGVTSVVPDMDASRPAEVNPANIVEAVRDWNVTQAFGSPAIWNVVGRYCEEHGRKLPSLRRVLSAGAPVPPHVLQRIRHAIAADGEVHTPYGATEALPVASISATEVLSETAARSQDGAGTCVGHRFSGIEWKVIRIVDEPLPTLADVEALPRGEIGELIVRGPVVTRRYVTRVEANPLAKISDGDHRWHRMGDVGYLDEQDRFWFCGRMAHRVLTSEGPLYTICCEAIINGHPRIYRSALVGIGEAGNQTPVIAAEPWPDRAPATDDDERQLVGELAQLAQSHSLTQRIRPEHILLHASLPVDIRHNAKIFREQLAPWAARKLGIAAAQSPGAMVRHTSA